MVASELSRNNHPHVYFTSHRLIDYIHFQDEVALSLDPIHYALDTEERPIDNSDSFAFGDLGYRVEERPAFFHTLNVSQFADKPLLVRRVDHSRNVIGL